MDYILRSLIKAALCGDALEPPVATEKDWEQCYKIALQQNVLAMTFPVLSQFPKEQRPSFALWSKWMAYAQRTAEQSRHMRDVVKKVGGWLSEDGLSTTVVKGFSLSELYPEPDLREFSDIDIYSGDSFPEPDVHSLVCRLACIQAFFA